MKIIDKYLKESENLFKSTFSDIRSKAKKWKKEQSKLAVKYIRNTMIKELKNKGIDILFLKLSLGRYRGSHFITSAKLSIKCDSNEKAEKVLNFLTNNYSPKFKLKDYDEEDKIAKYNVR